MGLAIGWRLLREGVEHVEIFEAGEAGKSGASWVAAGMLSPRAEAGFEDLDLYEEGLQSLDLYPQFLEELCEDVGDLVPEIDRCGTLVLATNADEVRELDRQYEFRKRANIPVERLSGKLRASTNRSYRQKLPPRSGSNKTRKLTIARFASHSGKHF